MRVPHSLFQAPSPSRRRKIILFIFLCNLYTTISFAAQHIDKLWSSFTLNGNYNLFLYYLEPQLRLAYADNPFQQFMTNVGGGYAVTPEWQFWFGETFSEDSQDAVPGSLDEYRLWEQILWNHPIQDNLLVSRTRLEERKSLNFTEWSIRIRERISFTKPLLKNLSFVISDEFFFNLNHTNWIVTKTFDQNRAYVGLEQQLSSNSYLSAGYMNQYLSFSNPQYNSVMVINYRLNLFT